MSLSRGHYVHGSGRGTRPGRVVSVVVTPIYRDLTTSEARGAPLRYHQSHTCETHWTGTRWTAPAVVAWGSATDCLTYIHSLGRPGSCTHVIAPIASDAMVLLRWFDWLDAAGCKWAWSPPGPDGEPVPQPAHAAVTVRGMILRGTPDIVDYRYRGVRFRWVSASNYFREPESTIAQAVGHRWRTDPDRPADSATSYRPPDERAELWCRAVTVLADWWVPLGAGRWPASLPTMAYAFLKSRLARKTVATHKDERVIPLERSACHGGRSTTWYYGDIRPDVGTSWPHPDLPGRSPWGEMPGPVYHWDVRAMYASLMRDGTYPVRLSHYARGQSVKDVSELLTAYEAVARVSILSDRPEYPHRHAGRVLYPVGRYVTTLAGDELRQAVAEGSVTDVLEAAYYWRGRPFERAATELLAMRDQARSEGRLAWELIVKLITNSVTGKLAQRHGRWVAAPEVAPEVRWGEWAVRQRSTGAVTHYRARAGLVERLADEERGTGTITAAYACLTAAGRMMMRRIRESLPDRSVISQATDGIWVTGEADRVLSATYAAVPSPAGTLRRVAECSTGRWLDATHYIRDGRWTLSGFSSVPPPSDGLKVSDAVRWNPVAGSCDSAPTIVWERARQCVLTDVIREGGVTPDGWLTPYRLPGRGPGTGDGPREERPVPL